MGPVLSPGVHQNPGTEGKTCSPQLVRSIYEMLGKIQTMQEHFLSHQTEYGGVCLMVVGRGYKSWVVGVGKSRRQTQYGEAKVK